MRRAFVPMWLLLTFASAAKASSVGDEFGIGGSQPSTRDPNSLFYYDQISAALDFSDEVSLLFAGSWTHDLPTARASRARWGSSAADIQSAMVGLDWQANDHVDLSGWVDYSPPSTQTADASASVPMVRSTSAKQADVLLRSNTGTQALTLNLDYATAGDSDFELSFYGQARVAQFESLQEILRVETKQGPTSPTALLTQCAAATGSASAADCKRLRAALSAQPNELTQARVAAGVTAIFNSLSRISLDVSYYVYDKDPTTLGYFGIDSYARGLPSTGGTPVAPLLYTLRPQLSHKFGPLNVDVWYQFGQYVDDQGYSNLVGVKMSYRLARPLKIWVSALGQQDVDASNGTVSSGTVAAGLKFYF